MFLKIQRYSKLPSCHTCIFFRSHTVSFFYLCTLISDKISALEMSENRVRSREVMRRDTGLFLEK